MLIRFLDWMISVWRRLCGRPDGWPLDAQTVEAISKIDPNDIDPIAISDAMRVTIKHATWLCDTAVRQGLFKRIGNRYVLASSVAGA